jgi:hypothetical protein
VCTDVALLPKTSRDVTSGFSSQMCKEQRSLIQIEATAEITIRIPHSHQHDAYGQVITQLLTGP